MAFFCLLLIRSDLDKDILMNAVLSLIVLLYVLHHKRMQQKHAITLNTVFSLEWVFKVNKLFGMHYWNMSNFRSTENNKGTVQNIFLKVDFLVMD